ncbi:MAG TPA: Clp protease N-terminal domain-containing protein [Hyphomicrobiaceae bacterium]|nr:Clp protease N-terminal domain-containing protein [Hyphomicrobiaceae bacterium]
MAVAEDIGQAPAARALAITLSRATHYAYAQGHRYITIEHALLALTEDAEACRLVMEAGGDVQRLRDDVAAYLGRLPDRLAPGERGPMIHPELTQIIDYASAAARRSPRPQVSGAVLLAAIIGEGRSVAASILTSQGLTFQSAIDALTRSTVAPLDPPAYAQPDATGDLELPPWPASPTPSANPADVPAPPPYPDALPGLGSGAPLPTEPLLPFPSATPAPSGPMEQLLARARERVNAGRPVASEPPRGQSHLSRQPHLHLHCRTRRRSARYPLWRRLPSPRTSAPCQNWSCRHSSRSDRPPPL